MGMHPVFKVKSSPPLFPLSAYMTAVPAQDLGGGAWISTAPTVLYVSPFKRLTLTFAGAECSSAGLERMERLAEAGMDSQTSDAEEFAQSLVTALKLNLSPLEIDAIREKLNAQD